MNWTPRQYRMVGHTALVVAVGSLIGLAISQQSTDFACAADRVGHDRIAPVA
jgi:hypothetical protein